MPISGSPSPRSPRTTNQRRMRGCARRCERGCCTIATYFPLVFVYGLTTWAVSVEIGLGLTGTPSTPTVPFTRKLGSAIALVMYIMLCLSYTVAVFTDPGSPTGRPQGNPRGGKYSVLPIIEPQDSRKMDTITVSSTGAQRYCKKCQHAKPDRTHHCSTCKRCVLKMDHHCPWLSTCLGLHNYKAFILFLIYVSLFCWACFASTAQWVYYEIFASSQYSSEFAPVQVIILAVLSGIIGLVITGFTGWHLYLCLKGQTTIECLEKTRYLSGVRRRVEQNRVEAQQSNQTNKPYSEGGFMDNVHKAGAQLLETHANAVPGVLRYEEGEEHTSPVPDHPRFPTSHRDHQDHRYDDDLSIRNMSPAQESLRQNYSHFERDREQDRYEEYMDDQESEGMPNAFDLGYRGNLRHLFGPSPWLWFLPICNTTGDGWKWEVNPKWIIANEDMARRKEARMQHAEHQRNKYNRRTPVTYTTSQHEDGRFTNSYDDDAAAHGRGSMSMKTFSNNGRTPRRQRRDFDRAGANGEVDSFEVSDSVDSSQDSDDRDDYRR